MQHQRVALLTIGQPRSAAHPAVAASFDLLRSSLLRDGHSVSHFMWLTPPHTPLRSDDAGWLRALEVYKPTVLRFANDTLPCRPACRIRCDTHGHDSAIEWLRQFYAVHRAYQVSGNVVTKPKAPPRRRKKRRETADEATREDGGREQHERQ